MGLHEGFRVKGVWSRVQYQGFRVQGLGSRVQYQGFRVQVVGSGVQYQGAQLHRDSGLRVVSHPAAKSA
jgi:hypothetical protein